MQKVIVFRKMSFWTSQPDMLKLNQKIQSLNKDGWKVQSIVPNVSMVGVIRSFTLLLEK
ncbi:DUF4177 domain-containing protein [Gilvimarinus agarilyticus]|uniref:DUF4177 domain-containing protein n=1 Tax=Gilvimarinus sp. 2_MG-2023 TaxID=3062666 RepID=UPI001C081815|nr:DUF4177 domain-containing protein [Gilvimarinus sp. 2_MG-2023]MBU2886439.1 DUF4177 domain-containing protein [Gilvimarinus agarilyticus]MDO6571118.1 DUF4177 domain-containing protein [Gilvimarinus sp. 2_MG-2023]